MCWFGAINLWGNDGVGDIDIVVAKKFVKPDQIIGKVMVTADVKDFCRRLPPTKKAGHVVRPTSDHSEIAF